jgi:hypothetical protein
MGWLALSLGTIVSRRRASVRGFTQMKLLALLRPFHSSYFFSTFFGVTDLSCDKEVRVTYSSYFASIGGNESRKP